MRPAMNVRIELPSSLLTGVKGKAQLLRYDSDPQTAQLRTESAVSIIELPELRLWTLAVIE